MREESTERDGTSRGHGSGRGSAARSGMGSRWADAHHTTTDSVWRSGLLVEGLSMRKLISPLHQWDGRGEVACVEPRFPNQE